MGLIERWECPEHGATRISRPFGSCGAPRCGTCGKVAIRVEYIPASQFAGAVEANAGLREAVSALRSAVACGEPLTPVLQDLVNRALSHPGGQ
jgi:hypothetical protein